VSGFCALLLGGVNAVMRKGTATHRTIGRTFTWAMLSVGFTSLGLASIHPNLFLALVGAFSTYLAWGGYRAARLRTAGDLIPADGIVAAVAAVTGVALLVMAVLHENVVMVVFGLVSCGSAATDLRVIRRLRAGTLSHGAWLQRHIGLIGGSYIAVWTAFLVVNIPFRPSFVGWLLPTVVGVPIIIHRTRAHMKRRTAMLFALLISVLSVHAVAGVNHSQFTAILKQHVSNGVVNYSALKNDKRLLAYIDQLKKEDASELTGDDKKAFWINAYNAVALRVVCDNMPIASIQDIKDVWSKKLITIDGESYGLNDIENSVLRPLGDPRIHFALVCAAQSCPPLRSEAYLPATINAQLDDQGRAFLRSTQWNAFDTRTSTATLSKIFDWYSADFGGMYSSMLRYVAGFTTDDVSRAIKAAPEKWTVKFSEYRWTLNGK
jgi:uncharacterized membrane protein